MQYLPLTLSTQAENLALDEALLEQAEQGGTEVLRLWESDAPMVVVGRASLVREEVNLDLCRERAIAVLRRASGGAAIVTGPGCLMYAVVLSIAKRPQLRAVDNAHQFVLERIAKALGDIRTPVFRDGTSDLAIELRGQGRQKVSGNSLRVKRDWLLYHGTLLYDFDISLIQSVLRTPPREPDYRAGRDHAKFVANLPLSRNELVDALKSAWRANATSEEYPRDLVEGLLETRYGNDEWNLGR